MKYDLPKIYFIRPCGQDGPIKIGCSVSPEKRLKAMLVWSPLKLEIVHTMPGDLELEREIHDRLLRSHSHGEWFHATPEILQLIADLLSGTSIGDAIDLDSPAGSIRFKRYRKAYQEPIGIYPRPQ